MTDFDLDIDPTGAFEALSEVERDWSTDAVFRVGTNQDYAVILEFGRGPVEADDAEALRFETAGGETVFAKSVSGHPPYPFFYPAVREFQVSPLEFVIDNTGFSAIRDIPNGDALVRAVATALENKMKDNANAQDPSADRSPGTHPDHPVRDSGALTASIQAIQVR